MQLKGQKDRNRQEQNKKWASSVGFSQKHEPHYHQHVKVTPRGPPKQSHAEDHTEQTDAASGKDHRWRTGRLQSREDHHRADFNLSLICEKHLQQQQDLCHVSIDFKEAFNRIWRAALWATMKKYISGNVIQVDKTISRVLFNTEQMDRSLRQSQASSTWPQLYQTRVPSLRYSPE